MMCRGSVLRVPALSQGGDVALVRKKPCCINVDGVVYR